MDIKDIPTLLSKVFVFRITVLDSINYVDQQSPILPDPITTATAHNYKQYKSRNPLYVDYDYTQSLSDDRLKQDTQ